MCEKCVKAAKVKTAFNSLYSAERTISALDDELLSNIDILTAINSLNKRIQDISSKIKK